MEPISLALGVIGLGLNIFGGAKQAENAKQQAQVSSQIAGYENQENDVRHEAMVISSQRSQIENLRTAQRARAAAIQAGATQTGSLTGSGVVAGSQNAAAQGAWGAEGISNQVGWGNQIYGIDKQIGAARVNLAQLGGQAATDQGIASLGGAIMKSGPFIGNLFGGGKGFSGLGWGIGGGWSGTPSRADMSSY